MLQKTKLIITLSLMSIIFFSFGINDSNAVQQKISIFLNGKEKTGWDPQFIDGRVYVPVRFITESLGSEVSWDDKKQAAYINTDIKMIASIPEKEIYLYALNKKDNMYKDLILSINGVKKAFDWETIATIEDLPQLYYLDLNNDQNKELVIILSKGHGTGFSSETIHVIDPEIFTEYSIENPLNIINDNVKTKIISDTEVEIKIGDTISNINLTDIPDEYSRLFPTKISEIRYGNFIQYEILNNTIKATVGIEGDYLKYIGDITIEYSFKDDEFKMNNISYLDGYGSNKGIQPKATSSSNLTDTEAKDILYRLIPQAVDLLGIFNGFGAFKVEATKTTPGEDGYALVIDEKFKSVADLKTAVEEVFTKDMAQTVFYSRYLTSDKGDRPLYKDYEGKLYQDTQNGGHGWATKFLIDTARLKGQKDNVAEIELEKTVLDDPADPLTIRIEYVNGKWLLASRID